MPVSIKTQHDYLLTEVNVDLPADRAEHAKTLGELDYLMKASHGTGKIVAVYSQGALLGINVEQKTKIRGEAADKVRELVGVVDKEINGYHK